MKDVIYFGGGYSPWGKKSDHNRYAADEAGFGRDDKAVVGFIPGSFAAARSLALQQSIEFLRWVELNTAYEVHKKLFIFGSIQNPVGPPSIEVPV